jgi:hypothetical protein
MSILPKVASNFHTECAKCGQDRYHKVLAHTSATSAKLECEVCKGKKTVKFEGDKTVAKAKKPAGPKKKTKAAAVAEARNAKFREMFEKHSDVKSQPYRMATVFPVDAKIEHPKFGVGFVTLSLPDKIQVAFEDIDRHLVHGRK